MRLLRYLRHHPMILLGLLAAAFAVWVWADVFRNHQRNEQKQTQESIPPTLIDPSPLRPVHAVADRASPHENGDLPTPQTVAQRLPKLKPGMTRTAVEGLIGAPSPRDIHPVNTTGGKITYRLSYDDGLEPPPPVRPIRELGRPETSPRTLVTLEFAATHPGHPLIEVHYPDPLF